MTEVAKRSRSGWWPCAPMHEEAWRTLAHFLEQHVGDGGVRRDGMEAVPRTVRGQEVPGQIRDGGRLRAVLMGRRHVDVLATRKPEELERLERAGGLTSAAVGDDDALGAPLRQLSGDDHRLALRSPGSPRPASRRACPASRSGNASRGPG